MNEERDITWSVNFEISIEGFDARWEDLTETEQQVILQLIADDYYNGQFLADY